MDNLLTFNLRVPVGVQVVSHLISENTLLEQFMLILSSTVSGCKFDKHRKEIEALALQLQSASRMELQGALALYAGKVAEQVLANFVPEVSRILGKEKGTPVIDPPPPPSPPSPPQTPEEQQQQETQKQLSDFAAKNLAGFPQFSPQKIQDITSQAAESIHAIAAKSHIPEPLIPKAAQLAFYDFTVLYDDSVSMGTEPTRIPTTQQTIRGLYKAAKLLNPRNHFSLRSFEGADFDDVASEKDLADLIAAMTFDTGANVAGPLKQKVLDPLSAAAAGGSLRPTVVVIITDGDLGSSVADFAASVTGFKAKVEKAAPGPAVLFLLCRVGTDEDAAASLKVLDSTPGVKDLILYAEESIDTKLAAAGGDVDTYVGVVIQDLVKAMDLQVVA
ncbi:uncharacterized protein ACLA_085450 [Aspergillus clavatus NRRL 1]|uniref:VWFA domain-containing protein n=1 Tax=Aspergillus clavatus (strain ATCC 1007 / CBS 513.65 / DSM 816 / NCTC 3887 / NRRL 1 / QM 1276 / 107) TaxID=344612 RepID=A1CU63_ASPCL|nr:uncharacterized protein ACLA_085450 [Aspergillus clavatus NRRL 1]EAW06850.1 hypothetical protein ACLA_085450 [Aspergillus clavatus NRRL 1]